MRDDTTRLRLAKTLLDLGDEAEPLDGLFHRGIIRERPQGLDRPFFSGFGSHSCILPPLQA